MSESGLPETSYLCPMATVDELKKAPSITLPLELAQSHKFLKIGEFLNSLSKSAEKEGNGALAQSYFLLAHTAYLPFVVDDPGNPFKFRTRGTETPPSSLADFKESHLEILQWGIENPFKDHDPLVARFSDVLWVRLKDLNFGRQAIEAYLRQIKHTLQNDITEIFECHYHLKRACQIWKMLGSDAAIKKELYQVAEGCLYLQAPEPSNYTRLAFFEVMADFDLFDESAKWLQFSEGKIEECLKLGYFDNARGYADCATTIAKRFKDQSKEKALQEKIADTFAEEYLKLKANGSSPLMLQEKIRKAIEANRRVGGRRAQNDALHGELNEIQKAALKELKEISVPFDAKDLVEPALESIRDKDTYQALQRIAAKAAPPILKQLKESAQKTIRDFPLQALFPTIRFNEKGRTVIRQNGGCPDSEDAGSALLLQKAMEHFAMSASVCGLVINQMRKATLDRGDSPNQVLEELLRFNPFVPEVTWPGKPGPG